MEDQEIQFKINPGKQEYFCSLPDTIFEALYGGAKGGGKSHALRLLPVLREWFKIPTFHGIILRRTYPELEKHQIIEAKKIYPLFGGKFNDQKHRCTFPSGAIVDFGSAENESDIRNYDSGEYHYIAFDELTSFTEFQYRYMLGMCRSSDIRLPHIVRSGSNPGGIGHGWVRDRFVEPYKEGGKILIDKNSGMKRIFIQAFATDNPVLLQATPEYLEQLDLLPEAERRAKKYGDWYTFSGQVFREFRNERMPDEPENALHCVEDIEVPKWAPTILAVDWGHRAMTYALWGKALPDKRALLTHEYSEKERTTEEWATDIAERSIDDYPSYITLDPSAWQQRGAKFTIAEEFSNAWFKVFGKYPPLNKADNDRVGGKMLIHDYLRWKPLKVLFDQTATFNINYANTILRIQGLEAYRAYVNKFIPKEPETLPKLLILKKHCPIIIKTLPLCVYNDKNNVEDVAEFEGDDPYDTIRYWLKAVGEFYASSKNEEQKYQYELKRVEAEKQLEASGDMTSFYRKMEMLDAQTPKLKGFRLKRHSRRGAYV